MGYVVIFSIFLFEVTVFVIRHDDTIGTVDMLQACDACADMGMTYSVIMQCTDCVGFP